MAFELGGSIVLRDLFSGPLGRLVTGARQVDTSFDQVGDSIDGMALSSKRYLAGLQQEIDQIQRAARVSGDISIGDLARYREISATVREAGGDLDKLYGKTQRTGGVMEALGKVTLVTATAFGALRAAASVLDLARVAAQAEAVETSFNNLTKGMGVNGQQLVDELQATSRGAIDQVTLLRVANRALLAGGAEMAEQLPDILRAARAASLATGQDIQFVFDTLTKGIVKASPLLIDNAEVYIQVGASVDAYARSLGKATDELTFHERKMAISNAVMEQTVGLEQRLGIEATTSAEQIASLSAAVSELQLALGGALNKTGLPKTLGDLASSARAATETRAYTKDLRELQETLEAMGESDAARALDRQLAAIDRQRTRRMSMASSLQEVVRVNEDQAAALADLAAQAQTYTDARKAAENPELAAYRRARDLTAATMQLSEAEQKAAEASSAFAAALSEANQKTSGLEATAGNLANIVAGMQSLAGMTPKLPQITTLFGTDTDAIRTYLAEVERIAPEQANAVSQVNQWVDAFEGYRESIIGNALELTNNREALEKLAQAFPEFGGNVAGLVDNFDDLPPVIQGLVQFLGGFGIAFETAVDKATAKLSGIDAVKTKLEGAAAAFQSLANIPVGALQTPELPKDLAFDTGPWREYLNTIRQVYGEAGAEYVQTTERTLRAMEAQQQAVAQAALAIDDYGARLDYLAGAILGPAASTEDLLAATDRLPAVLQAAIDPALSLADAVERLQAAAAKPVTIGVRVAGMQNAMNQVDSLALRLAGVLNPDQVRQFRDRLRLDAERFWTDTNAIDEFGLRVQQEAWLSSQEKIVSSYLSGYQQMERGAAQAATRIADSAGALRSKIESALRVGLEVTPEDFALTDAGQYQDKALEAARRLAAVVERGFGELEIHPDWAAALKIPPEVLAGTEAGLKAWAARTRADVEMLARPDMIDWDAFLVSFQQQLDREAAQDLTVDIAVEKLNAAGLLSGSPEEQRKKVAEALGLAMPEMTIDALFKTQTGAAGVLLSDLLGGADALEVPVRLTPAQETAIDSPTGFVPPSLLESLNTLNDFAPEPVALTTTVDLVTAQAQGLEAGQTMAGGFVEGASTVTAGRDIGLAWATDFAGNAQLFEAIGLSSGKITGEAYVTALKGEVGTVKLELARMVAPEVAAILQRQDGGLP